MALLSCARGLIAISAYPNYVITITETFLLPLVFGAVAFALIMTAVWGTVLAYKIKLENWRTGTQRRA